MPGALKTKLTPAECLAVERKTELRHEFFNGETFAMAGTCHEHCLAKDNRARVVGNALIDGPCRMVTSDMRVKVDATGLFACADIVIYRDRPMFEDVA